jgi:hypothetical protein
MSEKWHLTEGQDKGLVGLGRSKMKRQLITIYDMSFSLSQ